MRADQRPDGRRDSAGRVALRVVIVAGVAAAAGLGWLGLQANDAPPAESAFVQPTLVSLSTELAASEARSGQPSTHPPTQSGEPTERAVSESLLVYATGGAGQAHLVAHPLAGGDPIPITSGPADLDPALSPQGDRVAFRSNRGGRWDLYLLDLASGEVARLTDTAGYEGRPTWSADGNWLAYEAYLDGDLDIWLLPVNSGSQPIQLTNHPAMDISPHWDPAGGRRIIFVSDRQGSRDVFMADLDRPTDRFLNLTQTAEFDEAHPRFSRDGALIAYATESGGLELVWTLDPDHTQADPIQRGPGTRPVWSPDASSLLVTLRSPHDEHLVTYSLGSGTPPSVSVDRQGLPLVVDWGPAVHPVASARIEKSGDGGGPRAGLTQVPQQQVGRMNLVSVGNLEAPNPTLVEAADPPFRNLREQVGQRAGWDFLGVLEHAFVGLNDPLPPGYAYNDWLYTGRAFAFPERLYRADWVEVVREDFGSQTYWRVYVRTAAQDGSQGEPLRRHPWDFDARYRGDPSDYDQGGRRLESPPPGYYVDFTAIAQAYGFKRQPALTNWQTFLPGARYNEFAYTEGLSWQEAMLQLYPAEAIATPTPFRSPTPTPTNTPWPTPTPWWWRWLTPSPTPIPPSNTPEPSATPPPISRP